MLILAFLPLRAERILFAHYTAEDGLSSNSVNAVCQDTNGFIWMATRCGISRFDGVNFLRFSTASHPEMPRNDLQSAFLLPNGRPAFSSVNAVLVSYSEATGKFCDISSFLPEYKFKHNVNGYRLQPSGEGLLFTACGLYRYNKQEDSFCKLPGDYANHVLSAAVDTFGRYWVGHFSGWFVMDSLGRRLPFADEACGVVNTIFPIGGRHLLLCSSEGPFWLASFSVEDEAPSVRRVSAPFSGVSAVVADADGSLWIGTQDDGLWKCRFSGGEFAFCKVEPLNEPTDALSKISSLFLDAEGNLWVSTQSSGVWRATRVEGYAYLKSKDVGLPVAVGASFCETPDGDVLMGTDGSGLFLLSPDLQLKRSFPRLASNSVLSIVPHDGDYLLGHWAGATSRLHLPSGSSSRVEYHGLSNARNTTKNILRSVSGDTLYVSTAGDGVYMGVDDKWERVALHDSCMASYPDIWFEGACSRPNGNVCLYSSRTIWSNLSRRFRALIPDLDQSMESNPLHVNHCVAGADNTLYAATNKGILVFSPSDVNLGVMDFLPSAEFASLLFDGSGTLWASGSCGIVAIDLLKRTFETVMPETELPTADYFTGRASLLASSGNLFFGCKDGFVLVQPHAKAVRNVNSLAFTRLSVRGEGVEVGSPLLPLPLKQLKELRLAYDQTHFSLGFDLVDLSLVNNFTAKYRIPQLDTAWVDLGAKRAIDVPFLPAGSFSIELAAFQGSVPVRIVSLPVKVSPPWWQSAWFMGLVLLLLAAALYAFYRARMRRQVEYRRQLQTEVDARTRDLHTANQLLARQKEDVQAANLQLQNALRQKDQLVSVVGHDLKNPMFAIVSTLRRMVASIYTPAQQQQMLARLAGEAEGLQGQLVSLLQWASGEVQMQACNPQPVDANVLVSEALSLLGGLAREKDIRFLQQGRTAFATLADARMLATIVRNLVTNAVKFSPKGSSVEVRLEEEGGCSLLSVSDSGVGMSAEKVDELLAGANVSSTSGTEQEAGFGFGFRMVLLYVKQNGGTIAISSAPGRGTSVRVSLPLCADVRLEAPVSEPEKAPVAINSDLLSGKTILVVDDDELILSHVSSLLSPYVQVLQAHNGTEGVEVAKAQVPDLIVSDVDMPQMGGIEMARTLGQHLLTSNIPLLFLSAKTDNSIRLEGLSLGAIDYIAKPFADDELLVKIANFLLWQQKLQLKALTKTFEGTDTAPEDTVNPLLEKIIGLVKENYTNPLYSLADLVSALGMSKATLSRRMKSISDKTPMEILTEYRLNMARHLLADGTRTIGDVAYAVGFNDPSYFSRRFKEVFGHSPKEVR